jgi:AraC-like DNA-binding protein
VRKKEGFQGQKAIVLPRNILSQYCERNKITNNLYVTDIGYYPKARFHYRERPRGAEQHILIYCQAGSGTAVIKKETYEIEAGDFFIVPMHTPHTYHANENNPWTIYWIHFKGSISDSIIDLFYKQVNGYKGFIQYDRQSIALFDEIYGQLQRGYGIDNLIYCNMCLGHFFTTVIYNDRYEPGIKIKNGDVMEKAIDFLSKNISEMLTLEAMASAVNLSPSHFSFLFKARMGFPPMEYFNHLKVQKACQYLLFTDMRIREIALELGIEDAYYFARMFTKIMGLSPKHYREKKIH